MMEVLFQEVKRNQVFFDKYYSGEWMMKVNDCTAIWTDGLLGLVDPECPVVVYATQTEEVM